MAEKGIRSEGVYHRQGVFLVLISEAATLNMVKESNSDCRLLVMMEGVVIWGGYCTC